MYSSKQDTQMATKHSTALIIRKMFIASLFTIAKVEATPNVVYPHMEYCL